MAMFENFPYTNLHEMNLDWLVKQLNQMTEAQVLSVNGMTGVVTLYENAAVQFPAVAQDSWQILRLADGTTRGIYFANDDTAFILHGNTMSEIYSQNNQPPYPVTRVNGLYGDIELYTEQYVRLPDLTDAQMTNWTFFRQLNGVSRGIQFDDDGTAYIIAGGNRYVLYSANNPPAYPVDSVNGQTGSVVLFTDVNAGVAFPAVTDAGISAWSLERNVNGTVYGLRLNDDGTLTLKVGASEYNVFTSNDPGNEYVTDAADSVQQVAEDSTDNYWGLIRDTTEGSIGLLFENSDPDDPSAYIVYTDSGDQQQTLKILTPADIPASSVVSVNAKSGIVVLYGTDIELSSGDARTMDQVISDLEDDVAYREVGNTATRNYNVNSWIIWKDHDVYRVMTPISAGDTLTVNTNIQRFANIGEQLRGLKNDMTTVQDEKAQYWLTGNYTLNDHIVCAGFITSSSQNIHFFYPTPFIKAGLSVSTISLSTLRVRGATGDILNISSFTGYTISCTKEVNGLKFNITCPTALSVTNNIACSVVISGTVTLS